MSTINEIIEKQRAFFKAGNTLYPRGRKGALSILANTIRQMEPEILEALKQDLGKSATESYMCEVGMALSEIRDAIKHVEKWSKKRCARTPLAQFPARSYIIPEPYGNVLIMAPWNYPFLLCISPLVSALAAGNTAVIKPSAYAPATSAIIKKIIEETFTEDYVAVVEGGRAVNTDLLEQKWDYIFFTGSKAVGKVVMEKASAHLTPVTLELGGKSPVIVDSRSDIKVSAARIVFGKYLNCGQTCVAPDYILVQEEVAGELIEECKKQIVGMFGEHPLLNQDYGKIIARKHFDRLCDTLDQVRDKVAFGSEVDQEALRIEPTIIPLGELKRTEEGWNIDALRIMQEEIFGPLMPVITYSDITDAVDYIDEHDRPLAAYIFTKDKSLKRQLLKHLHFGGGCVGDTIIHLATDAMPFGGVGASGMGCYHGIWGFETFSHLKSIVDKPYWLDIKMRYQPYGTKINLIRKFLK